jgi:hypothetical protein
VGDHPLAVFVAVAYVPVLAEFAVVGVHPLAAMLTDADGRLPGFITPHRFLASTAISPDRSVVHLVALLALYMHCLLPFFSFPSSF